jgi:hypothetical protein
MMLEGQAKGATEAQMLGAEQQTLARLELAQDAIVRAGRAEPSDAEVTRGAGLLAQGMTSAELSAVVEGIPSSQSLVLAFDALASGGAGAMAGVGSTVGAVGSVGAGASAGASASAASSVDVSGAGAVGVTGAGAAGSLSAAGGATAAVSGGVLGR